MVEPKAKKVREKKEKPKYNIWQNSVYVIKNAWVRDRMLVIHILEQIFMTVIISTIALFLPKTVVTQIISGVRINTLVITVLVFTAVTVVLQAIKNYFDSAFLYKRTWFRVRVCKDILVKTITTDYANLEEKRFNDAKQKANDITYNGSTSTEQIYYTFSSLGINLLGFIIYIVLLVSVNPLVLLITAVTTVFGVLVRRWANKWQHEHDPESAAYNKRLWYVNNIGNNYAMAKDIRLFAMTDWLKDLYNATMKLSFDFNCKVQTKYLIADIVDCVATFMREGVAYAYLIWQVLYFGLAVDNFVLIFAAIGGFSGWIAGILNDYSALYMHSLNYCRLRAYLEYPDKFKRDDGEPIAPEKGKDYSFELKNVSFRYSGAEENTLENINLTIKAGEKLAIVGLNGAGKTTLVKLLCGFYDPTGGEILLNGKDIRIYNRKQYYTLFTAVFQEFNILPRSIAENISQLPNDDKIDNDTDKINHCLELADLNEKVNSLPNGTASLLVKNVIENAVELSGGETQKLMLARALYKESPILILDEPTAALDPIAENRLYNRYNELSAGKTSIYISHRLASTRFCDRIILIDNKMIAESGTHDELLKLGGRYAELFEIQSKYYKDSKENEIQ
ncbi:MAG: ABC transporter ATP-binding protein/permease [Oscillospiraceae bacterium]|nr:ABC transporter ATP-binding protein/permease [Oscillospiraceae bacterium]